MEIGGESPTLRHILKKEKYWPCVCGELVIEYFLFRIIQSQKYLALAVMSIEDSKLYQIFTMIQ